MTSRLENLPCSLPKATVSSDTNPVEVASSFAESLENLTVHHFVKDALWRDTFALTGTLRTYYSASAVSTTWRETNDLLQSNSFSVDPSSSKITRIGDESAWLDVPFTFRADTPPAKSYSGIASLVPDSNGEWKVWVLRTILEQLEGQKDVDTLNPRSERVTNPRDEGIETQRVFDCVVIGGGAAGLSLAGRLQALGVSYVILDNHKEVGGAWKGRYSSAKCSTRPLSL